MPETDPDFDLLVRWGRGCPRAGDAFVERNFGIVHRFFRNKVRDDAAREDLVQETLLGCLEARGRIRGQSSLKTFLLAIARHRLLQFYERQRRQKPDDTLSSLRDSKTSPSLACARNQEAHRLTDALRRVPLDAQVVLELVYWEGLSAVEVATVLGEPLNTVYSRIRRAKLTLRAQLEAQTAGTLERPTSARALGASRQSPLPREV